MTIIKLVKIFEHLNNEYHDQYAIYTPMEERSRFHANMFNLAIVDDVYDESSIRREKRAKELMPARTIRESLEIMGDT